MAVGNILIPEYAHIWLLPSESSTHWLDYNINSIKNYILQQLNYLINFFEPSINSLEGPLVSDVIDQKNTLSPPRVRPNDGTESTLTTRVP